MTIPIGIHHNIPAADYHADPCEEPSLSSSIAKIIVEKTPRHAWFAHPRLNPLWKKGKKSTPAFDLGNVVHELILGKGAGFEIFDYPDYKSKVAQASRNDACARGLTPILTTQYEVAFQTARNATRALSQIPSCEKILSGDDHGTPFPGHAETVLIWRDLTPDKSCVLCRAMLDWIDADGNIWDIKTTSSGLSDQAISRAIVNYGYDISAAFYIRGMTTLQPDLAGRIKFRWVFVEVEEPFEVRVVEPDATTLTMGDRKAGYAIEKWRKCIEANQWPGYSRIIGQIEYPPFAENAWFEREAKEAEAAE